MATPSPSSPLSALLPHFKKPDDNLTFQPGQMWLLRHAPMPKYCRFADRRYGPTQTDPFIFVILEIKEMIMRPEPRSEEVTLWILTILTPEGRRGELMLDPSEWNFDGWIYV